MLEGGGYRDALCAAPPEGHVAVVVRHDAARPQQRARQLPASVPVRVQNRSLPGGQTLPAAKITSNR